MTTINRTDLVGHIAEKAGITKTDADKALSAFSDVLMDAVSKGNKVQIPGLLSVEVVKRSARQGRNPQTGETINIPERNGVKVSAGSKLKAAAK